MKLKPMIGALLIAASAVFTACDTKNEYHNLSFIPNTNQGIQMLFADQEKDTILFYSTDSWTASNVGEWFTLEKRSQDFKQGTEYIFQLPIKVEPNRTGKSRNGLITVSTDNQISLPLIQVAWLNIVSPTPVLDVNTEDITVAKFTQYFHATASKATLKFITYKDGAKLTTTDAWLSVPDTLLPAGLHEIAVEAALNPENVERQGRITLTSNGITNSITCIQDGKTN